VVEDFTAQYCGETYNSSLHGYTKSYSVGLHACVEDIMLGLTCTTFCKVRSCGSCTLQRRITSKDSQVVTFESLSLKIAVGQCEDGETAYKPDLNTSQMWSGDWICIRYKHRYCTLSMGEGRACIAPDRYKGRRSHNGVRSNAEHQQRVVVGNYLHVPYHKLDTSHKHRIYERTSRYAPMSE
jgi:hypothetical protein